MREGDKERSREEEKDEKEKRIRRIIPEFRYESFRS